MNYKIRTCQMTVKTVYLTAVTVNHSHFTYTIFFILTDHKYVARQG